MSFREPFSRWRGLSIAEQSPTQSLCRGLSFAGKTGETQCDRVLDVAEPDQILPATLSLFQIAYPHPRMTSGQRTAGVDFSYAHAVNCSIKSRARTCVARRIIDA